jgi:hypothetical protein
MNRQIRCAECKGKGLCGLPQCPITRRFEALSGMKRTDSYMGGAPSVFIGSHGYPHLSGGPLLVHDTDNPTDWVGQHYTIEDIVNIRSATIRGRSPIRSLEDELQEIALSSSPVDVEVAFHKPIAFDMKFDGILAPIGLSGSIRQLSVLDNAHVPVPVEKVTSDTDLRASEGIALLHQKGIDVYQINKLLTAGLLGVQRQMVPTRWAITAVDDTISKALKKKIMRYPPIEQIRIHSAELYGNQIIYLLLPGDWKFEMVEVWNKRSLWGGDESSILRDGENMKKRGYSPIAGAYYSARLAVTEYLDRIGRSSRVLVIRTISHEYWAPLGTWVIREAARQALKSNPLACPDLGRAIEAVTALAGSPQWLAQSRLIPEVTTQKTLFEF